MEESASRHGYFNPGEKASGTDLTGDWKDPKACLEALQKKELTPSINQTIIPWSYSPQPSRYADWAIPAFTSTGLEGNNDEDPPRSKSATSRKSDPQTT
jgi:hypothetical protein